MKEQQKEDIYTKLNAITRNGDIVFRRGKGVISSMIVQTLRDTIEYSHCGIIVSDNMVIHSISGKCSKSDGIQICSLKEFVQESDKGKVAVVRYRNGEGSIIASRAVHYLSLVIPFDHEFDSQNHDALYCSELPTMILNELYQFEASLSGNYIKFSSFFDAAQFERVY